MDICTMLNYLQILLCLASLYCVTGKPFLGEIKFKRNFEVEHKPIPFPPFKPFEFIKEIVTPFGKFGLKHGIGKRDLDSIKSVEDSEHERPPFWESPYDSRYEVEEPIGPVPLHPPIRNVPLNLGPLGPGLRPMVGPGQGVSAGPGKEPIVEITPKPVLHHLQEPKPVLPLMTDLKPIPPYISELRPEPPHIPEPKPLPAPPHPPVVITPPSPKFERPLPPREGPLPPQNIIPRPPPRGFHTDIAREQAINEYLKTVEQIVPIENSIAPEKPKEEVPVEPPPPPNPIVRGSRLALYFGNILLDVISQFLGGGRLGGILDRPVTI